MRASRSVLREAGGEIPPAYSPGLGQGSFCGQPPDEYSESMTVEVEKRDRHMELHPAPSSI